MPRLLFPADRTAFVYQGPGLAILVPENTGMQVFLDQACTQAANIIDPDSLAAIANSTVYTDDAGMFPEFWGPNDGRARLWGKTPGAPPVPLDANYGNRLDAIGGATGVPVNGDPGTFLKKASPADLDTEWSPLSTTDLADSGTAGRSVVAAASRKAAREALGIYVQSTSPAQPGWGVEHNDDVWIVIP